MKKSFLLIILISLVFLWLGSVSYWAGCPIQSAKDGDTCTLNSTEQKQTPMNGKVQECTFEKYTCNSVDNNAMTYQYPCTYSYSCFDIWAKECTGWETMQQWEYLLYCQDVWNNSLKRVQCRSDSDCPWGTCDKSDQAWSCKTWNSQTWSDQCGGLCTWWQSCQPNPWDTDNPYACQEASTTLIDSTSTSNCITICLQWGKSESVCAQECASSTPPAATSACKVASSDLSGDVNATGTLMGTACKCNPTYGEYYDAKLKKNRCGLCTRTDVCCGTKLNTKIPFIGDCIESSTQASNSTINETTAFPTLVTALVKILVSVILIASFVLIVVAGVMIATGDAKWGKDMIIKVAIWLALLGASGVILRLINPNFFG